MFLKKKISDVYTGSSFFTGSRNKKREVLQLRRQKITTKTILTSLFGNDTLANQYEACKLKGNKEDLKDLVAQIQIKLTLLWDDSKEKLRTMEMDTIKSDSTYLLRPTDDKDYLVVRNILSLIKKLEDKFNLKLEDKFNLNLK